jgi:integrase
VARTVGRLSALKVTRATKPGMYADGAGLYLQVSSAGARSWIYRFMLRGREREMGLGPASLISLAEARAKAADCRRLRYEGVDPIDARRAERQRMALDSARAITFGQCVQDYIAGHRAGWRNAKHASQWQSTLGTYAGPVIGQLPVSAVDTGLVLRVLEPIWSAKPETATRLRGRIEAILDWAKVRGYREGENPARWRGHLDVLLPAPSKVHRVRHHAALPFAEMPDFMVHLKGQDGVAARALEFTILTAARTGETLSLTWDELDEVNRVWTVPAQRMKAGKEHRVPLTEAALAVLETLRPLSSPNQRFVFPGGRRGKPLSNMAMMTVLRRMGRNDLTVHGFRSSFRDWAAERTHYPSEVVEMALAHAVGSKVEAAYRRGDLFEKRRELLNSWERFLSSTRPAQS